MASVAQDATLLLLPLLTALFAAGWAALLANETGRSARFDYIKGFAVALLCFVSVAIAFPITRSIPYTQALIGFLVVGWGFLIFPGFVGAAIAVWLLRSFSAEPDSAVEEEQAAVGR
jgi:hypothetical protein